METFEALKAFHHRQLQLASALRFNKRDSVDLNRVALYGTLLELTGCMIHLIEHKDRTGVPSLFRAFLEAAVELRNLMKDAGYIDHMMASHVDQWLKVLQEAKKGTNPYLASIAASQDLDKQITEHAKQLGDLKARGKQPLNVFERFERANMVDEYRSLYNFLSCDSHSNIRALISRHIEREDNDFKVVFYKDEPIETFLATLDSTAGLLIEASLSLHERFNSGRLADIQKMSEELNAMRGKQVG
jgi:Family of unknown function (DUF5677)